MYTTDVWSAVLNLFFLQYDNIFDNIQLLDILHCLFKNCLLCNQYLNGSYLMFAYFGNVCLDLVTSTHLIFHVGTSQSRYVDDSMIAYPASHSKCQTSTRLSFLILWVTNINV